MMTNTVSRLTGCNAAYNWMGASNSLSNLSFRGGNSATLLSSENNLRTSMLNDSLSYKASLLMDETNKRLTDENIKRTFSTFA